MKRVFLIGIMGSGKTHWGKLLAQELMQPFIDLDEVITTQEGISIAAIFDQHGEDYFRKLEADLLRNTMLYQPAAVIACGGGTPCFHANMDFMLQHGVVIWLHPDTETVVERIWKAKHKRPLIAMAETKDEVKNIINSIVEKRLPWYSRAHGTLTGPTVDLQQLLATVETFSNTNTL